MTVIAMNREMGSLGMDIAKRIARVRRRRLVYHEMVGPVANKLRLRRSHVVRLLDDDAGVAEEITAERASRSIFTPVETFALLRDDAVGVIRGWGAVPLLKDVRHVVRVRVCAPLAMRVRRMMYRLDTEDRAFVENEIALSDAAQEAITRRHFGVDWRDPSQYDLVLDTGRLKIDQCIEELEDFISMPSFRETSESVRVFNDRSLQWAVSAALQRDARTAAMNVAVAADEGKVRLIGTYPSGGDPSVAIEIALSVPGVEHVTNELEARERERVS